MDAKDLRTEAALGDRNNDGNTKYSQGGGGLHCNTNKNYHDVGSNSSAKVDVQTTRPCAVIGPDRVVLPTSNDAYHKKPPPEPWMDMDTNNSYHHPPEYQQKLMDYQHQNGNISPRQTYQENMSRMLLPPSYGSAKLKGDHNFPVDENSSSMRVNKLNVSTEPKYCDVPYTINPVMNDQKNIRNTDISATNINSTPTRNGPHAWPPNSANIRPVKPYGAPELYQYPDYASCLGPRPMAMSRPQRTVHEDSAIMYSETFYHDGSMRFKPYPTAKERYPQARYDYINNYPRPFHPPPPFPTHKYDLQKQIPPHPYPGYSQVPVKYIDARVADPLMNGYQRLPNQHTSYNNIPYRNQMMHPSYGPVPGNCLQTNKFFHYPESPNTSLPANKVPSDTNSKIYSEFDHSRAKAYPLTDGYYNNDLARSLQMKGQALPPSYPTPNIHGMQQHPYYRKEHLTMKNYEYNSHFRNVDSSLYMNGNPLSRFPSQYAPNTVAISLSDSNTSNDAIQTQGSMLNDSSYLSQASSASFRSIGTGIHRIPGEYYKKYDYRQGPLGKLNSPLQKHGSSNTCSKDKKNIDVRQFLQMWNEGEDESFENNNKEVIIPNVSNNSRNIANQYEGNKQEQLYVLGLVNVPSEELDKYEHIQKVSKLPENIKGYNSIDILNKFEKAIESSNLNNFAEKPTPHLDYPMSAKGTMILQGLDIPPRPISPLDVEAKISQSVIHKEVGCNFEIKPCSPKMLNVQVATPVHSVMEERSIEKVTNPSIVCLSPDLRTSDKQVDLYQGLMNSDRKLTLHEKPKIQSCNLLNTPCTNKSPVDSIKTNYSLQDLESNSGVCFASLPRLDNDIELNFPEVNQQFINANKVESVITSVPSKDLPNLDDEPNTKTQTIRVSETNELSPKIEKEQSKLSKYRKLKKKSCNTKEDKIETNAQAMRKDSVIIKNPENVKIQLENYEKSYDSPKHNQCHLHQINAQKDPINLRDLEDRTISKASDLLNHTNDFAIDFSINCNSHYNGDESMSKIIDRTRHIVPDEDIYSYGKQYTEQITSNSKNSFSGDSIIGILDKNKTEPDSKSISFEIFSELEADKEVSKNSRSNMDIKTCTESAESKTKPFDPGVFFDKNTNNELGLTTNELNKVKNTKENDKNEEKIIHNEESVCEDNLDIKKSPLDSGVIPVEYKSSITSDACNIILKTNHETLAENDFESKSIIIASQTSYDKSSSDIEHNNIVSMLYDKPQHSIQEIVQSNTENENKTDSFELLPNSLKLLEGYESPEQTADNQVIETETKETHNSSCTEENMIDTKWSTAQKEVNIRKNLFSPWMQNLILYNEGLCSTSAGDCVQNNEVVDDHCKNVENKIISTTEVLINLSECKNITESENIVSFTFDGMDKEAFGHTFQEKYTFPNSNHDNTELYESKIFNKNDFDETDFENKNLDLIEDTSDIPNDNDLNKSSIKICNLTVIDYQGDTTVDTISENSTQTDTIKKEPSQEKNSFRSNEAIHSEIVVKSDIKEPTQSTATTDFLKNIISDTNDNQLIIDTSVCESYHCSKYTITNAIINITDKSISTVADKQELESVKYNQLHDLGIITTQNQEHNNVVCISNLKPLPINDLSKPATPNPSTDLMLTGHSNTLENLTDLSTPAYEEQKSIYSKSNAIETNITSSVHDSAIDGLTENSQAQNKCFYQSTFTQRSVYIGSDIEDELIATKPSGFSSTLELDDRENVAKLKKHDIDTKKLNVKCFVNTNASLVEVTDIEISQEVIQSTEQEKTGCLKVEENLKHYEYLNNVKSGNWGKRNRCQKRSLSESAIEEINIESENRSWPNKRNKLLQPDNMFLKQNYCNIDIKKRRNSVSTVQNEENVSFCILIDESCILTEEWDETNKICLSELPEECMPCIPTVDSEYTEVSSEPVTYEDEISCDYPKTFVPDSDNLEEKAVAESWVEDVACVETVVTEDIAEDIAISNSSPRQSDSSDSEINEEIDNYNAFDHSDKVKHIYGDKMCSSDAQLVDTLYRTPQMNVNKTLINRESQNLNDCNRYYDNKSLEKVLSESNCEGLTVESKENQYDTHSVMSSSLLSQSTDKNIDMDLIGSEILNFDCPPSKADDPLNTISEDFYNYHTTRDDTILSCESSIGDIFSYSNQEGSPKCSISSSPEVSSTTSEERNAGAILLKITNQGGSRVSQLNSFMSDNNTKTVSCKYTEKSEYGLPPRPLITKAAQKYIPPIKETFSDLKVKLSLPPQSLIKLKQLKITRVKCNSKAKADNARNVVSYNVIGKDIPKKPKPKFEDVLKSIDEIQYQKHKEKSKKVKNYIPKVVIKKSENGSHYASTSNKEMFNPDLTGRKWQPWVFLEKNNFINQMAVRGKTRAMYSHRTKTYVLSEKFKKYKASEKTKFLISQPKLDNASTGKLKYTIRLKHV